MKRARWKVSLVVEVRFPVRVPANGDGVRFEGGPLDEAIEEVEARVQALLDRHGKRLGAVVGADYSSAEEEGGADARS